MASKNIQQHAGWSQASQRSTAIFYDQHRHPVKCPNGRPWWAIVEKSAEGAAMPMPVGPIMPMDWESLGIFAPWEPDQKYVVRNLGKAKPGATMHEHRFFIDYQAMLQDDATETKGYYDKAIKEARAVNLPAPKYGQIPVYEIRAVIGEPPRSPKIAQAAIAGDDWLLGFDREENVELARLLASGQADLLTVDQSIAAQSKEATETAALRKELDDLKTLMLASLKQAQQNGAVPPQAVGKTIRRPAKGSAEAKALYGKKATPSGESAQR